MSTFDELNKLFDVEEDNSVQQTEASVVPVRPNDKPDLNQDYDYSRGQLYNLISKGQEAIDGILEVAKSSDHPRAYEVALQGIKNVADMTDKLLELQKKMKDISEEPRKGPTNVTNALFVGSTSELQKLIKQQKISEDK
jgi:hypothetical protein